MPLEWNVYIEDVNQRKIKQYNIFEHGSFLKECKLHLTNFGDDKEKFLQNVKSSLLDYFWSKCEWEIILSDWPPSEKFKKEKIDVYDQVKMNWNIFSEWLWNNKEQLRTMR